MSSTTDSTVDQIVECAEALAGFGRWDAAIVELRAGLASHAESVELLSRLAAYEYFHGDKTLGAEAARTALGIAPNDARSLTVLL